VKEVKSTSRLYDSPAIVTDHESGKHLSHCVGGVGFRDRSA
jgi:hypothetical protein